MSWDKLSILINRLSSKQDELGYICVAGFVTGILALQQYLSVLLAITDIIIVGFAHYTSF